MSKGNESTSFAVNIEGNAAEKSKEVAAEIKNLRDRVDGSIASIRDMNSLMRNLVGTSDAVKKAKEELKAKVALEKAKISESTESLIKHGASLKATKEETDKLAEAASKEAAAAKKQAESQKALKKLTSMFTIDLVDLVIAMKNATVEVLKFGASLVSSAAGFANFTIGTADAARSAGLLREAAMGGNAQWGKNFGEQVEALARKVPTSRAEIDKLGLSLGRNRIGGQLWVDTLNAVTQASSALGDQAGSKIEEFITRGKRLGNFSLNPLEMIGSGVEFKEVADKLASTMHVSVEKARLALLQGRVRIGDGAAALREIIEKKFGKINLRQMISLENLSKKFLDIFSDITKNINLEPLLNSLQEIMSVFSLSEESGQALKQIVGIFGNDIVGGVSTSTPFVKKFLYMMILGAQDITIAYLKVRNSIRDFLGPDFFKKQDTLKSATDAMRVSLRFVEGSLIAVSVAVGVVVAGFAAMIAPVYQFVSMVKSAFTFDWSEFGKNVVEGFVKGFTNAVTNVKTAVTGLGTSIKKTFTDSLQIRSPSKVFEKYGQHTAKGYELGIGKGSDGARSAVEDMGNSKPSKSSNDAQKSDSKSSSPISISINIEGASNKSDAKFTADEVLKAIISALNSAGLPVPV